MSHFKQPNQKGRPNDQIRLAGKVVSPWKEVNNASDQVVSPWREEWPSEGCWIKSILMRSYNKEMYNKWKDRK